MTNPPEQPDSSNLDAYLDGALPAEQLGAMKREIEASPALRADLELQSRIDESLRRSFAPSKPPAQLLSILRDAGRGQAAPIQPRRRRLKIAAVAGAAAI